jgi:hypothetical protein
MKLLARVPAVAVQVNPNLLEVQDLIVIITAVITASTSTSTATTRAAMVTSTSCCL